MSGPKYPHITVALIGTDGNAFGLIGRTAKALRRGGVDESEVQDFMTDAMSGDYDHVLATIMATVEVD